MGIDIASRKARSTGLLGRGLLCMYRSFSGVSILLPPNSSRTDRLTVVVKDGYETEKAVLADLSVDELSSIIGYERR
jgi:hypothetical protein